MFSTILRIAQTEGIWALYDGLGPEVLKGFFSHGITMLMKDRIHSVIISLYYALQKALNKYPSPGEIAKSASDNIQETYVQGKEQASEAYAKSMEVVGNATESAKHTVAKGKEQAADVYSKSAEAAEAASHTAQDALQRGSQHVEDAVKTAKDGASDALRQARDVVVDTSVKDINGTEKDINE